MREGVSYGIEEISKRRFRSHMQLDFGLLETLKYIKCLSVNGNVLRWNW